MNNERRNELISRIAPLADSGGLPVLGRTYARDILAMLEADQDIDRISQKLADGDTELEYRPNSVAFKRAAPSITFKPWVPERVTLADRPDEVLTCICPKMPTAYRVVAINKSGVVHFLDAMNRPSDTVLTYRDPADYVVVDLDAAQPKTLADVPSDIFCVDDGGDMAVRVGSSVYMLADERFGRINKLAEDIPITRVLGRPFVNLVGDEGV